MLSNAGGHGEDGTPATFRSLGIIDPLCEACEKLQFASPTKIQADAIPVALQDRDIIGLAQTGSGKTAAFALPILQALWEKPQAFFACILAPTRELAYQIAEQFTALGSGIGVRCAVIVGGMDMMSQSISISKRPHIIIATPGRLEDHLANTKGFSLKQLKFLASGLPPSAFRWAYSHSKVMDEADRLLDMDFGPVIDKILKAIPRERRTFLYSATMTTKVVKLQRASLVDPVKIEVSSKYSTVESLVQKYLFMPFASKDAYFTYLINELSVHSSITFVRTVHDAHRLSIMLRLLGFNAIPLHGQLSQSHRLAALNKFKSQSRNILIATDVASRGLDIPSVDYVINYDIPSHSKDYIHRVGRTARAGRSGKSITLVTQYDVELLQRIEGVIGRKMTEFATDKEAISLLVERVEDASREAAKEIRENGINGDNKRPSNKKRKQQDSREDRDLDDDSLETVPGLRSGRRAKRKR